MDVSYSRGDEVSIQAHRQVTLKNVDVDDGSYFGRGVYIHTDGGVSVLDPGGINWNEISENPGTNLEIEAGGDVTLQKVISENSDTGYGVKVTTTSGKVTITNINTYYNNQNGLWVDAGGAISLTGADLRDDVLSSAMLDNTGGGSVAGVTVTNSTFYSSNSTLPGNGGLLIATDGAVLLNQVTSTDHNGFGAYITINNPFTAAVTVNKSVFSDNRYDGLHIESSGVVTINGITADRNSDSGANGVYINNTTGTGSVSVLATLGVNNFNDNGYVGLAVFSHGAVVLNNATANYNAGQVGIGIINTGGVAGVGKVTVTGVVVKHNNTSGLAITSNGVVTVTSVEAISNGLSGTGYTGIDITTTNGYNVACAE